MFRLFRKQSIFRAFTAVLFALGALASLQAQTPISGTVTKIDSDAKAITLTHDAEESVFIVGDGDLAWLKTELPIKGQVYKNKAGDRLEHIWPNDTVTQSILSQSERMMRRDTVERGSKAFRMIGESLPKFALVNHRGEIVQPAQNTTDYKIINFIFTRCTMPTMCPAATERMKRLQIEAEEAEIRDITLYSISFDPEYDTPGILNSYAERYNITADNVHFASGPRQLIDDILKQIGIITIEENGTIDHSMATVLVAPNGKILFRRDGSNWSTRDFLARIEAHRKSS